MKKLYKSNIYIALIHHPVINKNGEIITSAVTNLDLHDIARAAKTYGLEAFYIVTPFKDQAELVNKIIEHWVNGFGANYNSERRKALELVRVSLSYSEVIKEIKTIESYTPKTVSTTARSGFVYDDYKNLRNKISSKSSCEPYLLSFGTAWGLSDDFLKSSDFILGPIKGFSDYNHLSVRSAVSIILDRLLGDFL